MLFALPAEAEALRPVPDYFAEAIFASTMANSLAAHCPSVEVSRAAVDARRGELFNRLREDGFDPERAMGQMQDPTGQVHKLQSAFLDKYPLDAATPAQVCTAAISEIGNGTLIGSLLLETGS